MVYLRAAGVFCWWSSDHALNVSTQLRNLVFNGRVRISVSATSSSTFIQALSIRLTHIFGSLTVLERSLFTNGTRFIFLVLRRRDFRQLWTKNESVNSSQDYNNFIMHFLCHISTSNLLQMRFHSSKKKCNKKYLLRFDRSSTRLLLSLLFGFR